MNEEMNSGLVSDAKSMGKNKYYVVCLIEPYKRRRYKANGDVEWNYPVFFEVFHCWRAGYWYSTRSPDGNGWEATTSKKEAAVYDTRQKAELALKSLYRIFLLQSMSWIGRIFEVDEESAQGRLRFGSDGQRSHCS